MDSLRTQLDRARLYTRALRSTRALELVRPSQLALFLRGAVRVPPGPHLAVMYHAAAHPDREALVEYAADGVRRMTWGEFDATINRLANALFARGVAGGGRVALMLPNGSEHLIAQQAVARLGATAVQIGYRLKAGEIAYILGNAEPQATIVHADHLAEMTEARARVGGVGPMIVVSDRGQPSQPPAPAPRRLDLPDSRRGRLGPRDSSPEVPPAAPGAGTAEWDRALAAASPYAPPRVRGGDAGMIVYTSGTTGKSKGAQRTWKSTGLTAVADLVVQLGVRADERHLVVCPLYHSAASGFVAIVQALGGTLVLMNHFEPEAALDIIARERVTSTLMVPTMIVRITSLPAERVVRDTTSLRWVMSGAAPLPTEAARRFMDRFGPILWNFYGATETGLVTLAGPADHGSRPGTIGRALAGNEIRIVDDAGQDLGPGEVGELYTRNSMLITGYHRDAPATAASQRDGFFSVGDLARRDADGYYYLESRKHDLVISGGVNIYPREIEDLLHTHPGILEAAVIGVPDPEWGEALRAFVVPRAGHALAEQELIDFCRAGLADFKRPRKVIFVRELPRNPTGKVLKRELRDLG